MKNMIHSARFYTIAYLLCEAALILLIPAVSSVMRHLFAPGWMLLVCILFAAAVFCAIRLIRTLIGEMNEEIKRETIRAQNMIHKEHVLAQIKAEHDMEHLLKKLQALERDENDSSQHIDKLLYAQAESLFIRYCPNPVVDALLYHKSLLMKEQEIDFSIVAAVPAQIDLDPYAVISVLMNLIDNAIEAVCRLEHEKRTIDIHIRLQANMLVCQIKNPIAGSERLIHGISTKKDQKRHGLGLLIIERTCHEHDGLFSHTVKDGYCTCMATLRVGAHN